MTVSRVHLTEADTLAIAALAVDLTALVDQIEEDLDRRRGITPATAEKLHLLRGRTERILADPG